MTVALETGLQSGTRLFHKTGLIYFWFLNDVCAPALIERQIEAFAAADVAAVCLHPRPGLLFPYGGEDWFAFIHSTVLQCARRGLDVWLYDEDPYPSGSAGGRIIAEHPEYAARAIEMIEPTLVEEAGCHVFPTGKLLWCGILDADGNAVEDLTARVGMVRRSWTLRDPWDSRYYYPGTPRYSCPRSSAGQPEFAVRCGSLGAGHRLVAFIARPCETNNPWGGLHDSLNPQVTRLFQEMTHERYAATVGDLFGREITAMFTDEPKYFGVRPWTAAMFPDFQRRFGYDLRPRLADLFSTDASDRAVLTRLHYREWCGERFAQAWLRPVAEWCRAHGLPLIGHISPEDDPVQQGASVSNLFPLYEHFDLPGLDLIIPAVGDREHPLINVGVTAAVSAQQQQGKPGVLSESLACSGLEMTAARAGTILLWQAMMGVTTPVVHGAFNSTEGPRRFDAPPDYGPLSDRWEGMQGVARTLESVQRVVRDSVRQVAPVAILWTIRSFHAQGVIWEDQHTGLRADLVDLLHGCLDRQVGTHLLDEAALWDATLNGDGAVRLGNAEYRHLLVPSSLVLHERTLGMLVRAREQGVAVRWAGAMPRWIQTAEGLRAFDGQGWTPCSAAEAIEALPRLLPIAGDARDIRCTAWEQPPDGERVAYLLMNLRPEAATVTVAGTSVELPAGEVQVIRK